MPEANASCETWRFARNWGSRCLGSLNWTGNKLRKESNIKSKDNWIAFGTDTSTINVDCVCHSLKGVKTNPNRQYDV